MHSVMSHYQTEDDMMAQAIRESLQLEKERKEMADALAASEYEAMMEKKARSGIIITKMKHFKGLRSSICALRGAFLHLSPFVEFVNLSSHLCTLIYLYT